MRMGLVGAEIAVAVVFVPADEVALKPFPEVSFYLSHSSLKRRTLCAYQLLVA